MTDAASVIEDITELHTNNNAEEKQTLRDCVAQTMTEYFNNLEGHPGGNLYQLVLQEVEQPLLESVMQHVRGNQSKAAILLGLNRGTLRKKLKQYGLHG